MRNYDTITDLGFEFVDGIENPSGLSEQAFLVRASDIAVEAVPSAVGTTAASIVQIATSHTLKAGKKAIPVEILYGKSGAPFKLSGEELSKVFESDPVVFIPQLNAQTLGGAVVIKNSRYLVFVRRPGQLVGYWQIGSKGMTAKVQDIAGGFGSGATGEVGLMVSLKAFGTAPMYEYQGELPVAVVA